MWNCLYNSVTLLVPLPSYPHKGRERTGVFMVINHMHTPPQTHILVIDASIVLKSSN